MSDQSNGQRRDGQRPFNPHDYVVQLKGKDGFRDYLPVQWRLVWFRERCPAGTIETELLQLDLDRETEEEIEVWDNEKEQYTKIIKQGKGFVLFKAVVKDGKGGVGTGTKSEKAASFPDYIEKAETGAIGRALAALGFGTQFAPELNEEHRIVDSPVARNGRAPATRSAAMNSGNRTFNENGQTYNATHAPVQDDPTLPITEQQLSSIHKLCSFLSKAEPENVTDISYVNAKKLIHQLTTEYKEHKQNNRVS